MQIQQTEIVKDSKSLADIFRWLLPGIWGSVHTTAAKRWEVLSYPVKVMESGGNMDF